MAKEVNMSKEATNMIVKDIIRVGTLQMLVIGMELWKIDKELATKAVRDAIEMGYFETLNHRSPGRICPFRAL